jgi:UTP:GlnB (protein PII) uridylyltransferase
MSTGSQITANQQNALASTGPTTPEGRAKAAANSTKHGFTCQTLILAPDEKQAYEAHVAKYKAHHNPQTHQHLQLVQQLADLHWTIHQIFVHQSNHMALMTAVSTQLSATGADALTIAAALVPLTRTLNTLSTYETRRRRAAKDIQEELENLEANLKTPTKAPKSPVPPPARQIGSVYSNESLEELREHTETENRQALSPAILSET